MLLSLFLIVFVHLLENAIDRNTNLYFSSFIHGIHLIENTGRTRLEFEARLFEKYT